LVPVLRQFLSVKSCFNIHNANTVTKIEEPIAAISAMSDILISSHEN